MTPDLMDGRDSTRGTSPDAGGPADAAAWTPRALGHDGMAMGYEAAVPWLWTGGGIDAVSDEWHGRDGG